MARKKILILGSGIGGLVAGLILAEDHDITIIEVSSTPGGRVKTLTIDGNQFDIGATIITPHLINFFDKKLGIKIDVVNAFLDVVATEERNPMRFDFGKIAIEDLEKITHLTLKETLEIGLEAIEELPEMGKLSALEFFNNINDMPDELKTYLTAGLVAANVPVSQIEASVLNLLAFSHNFKYPKGGVGVITEKLAKKIIKLGGNIIYNSKVIAIDEDKDGAYADIETDGEITKYEAEIIISNVGVKSTLRMVQFSDTGIEKLKQKISKTKPTLQPTILMYKFNQKPDYRGDSPLLLYYPTNTAESIDKLMVDIEGGSNPIEGFYIHFPALIDPKASSKGEYPISFWLPSTQTPSEEDLSRFRSYVEDQVEQYFIPGFKENATFVRYFTPKDAIPYFNAPGTISPIADVVNYPSVKGKLTEKIWMAGAAAEIRFAPSTIQAVSSGYNVAIQIKEELHEEVGFWTSVISFFKRLFNIP